MLAQIPVSEVSVLPVDQDTFDYFAANLALERPGGSILPVFF